MKNLINRWNDWSISGSKWRAIWTGAVEGACQGFLVWGVVLLVVVILEKLTGKNTEEDS